MPFTIVTQGSFVSTGNNTIINLPSSADYFKTWNYTQLATTANPGVCVMGEWFNNVTAYNDGIRWTKTNSSNALNATLFSTSTASNGFIYQSSYPAPEAAVTGTAISQASSAVVTMNNSYNNGDRVVLYGTTGMLQISGMVFTVSSVSSSQFTLLGLNSSAFAAPATAVTARRIAPANRVEPRFYYVTGITQANNAVVTVSEAHNFQVGQKIEFTIPASFGMVQLNNFNQGQSLPAVITAVSTYTFTINVNTSNYSAFAFPASSGSPTTQLFATVAPAGQSTQNLGTPPVQTGYNFVQVPFHTGLFIPYMQIAGGAQSPGGQSGDTIVWQACKIETS